eukprot:1156186-Pelagomonas_calceolata.AAC.13
MGSESAATPAGNAVGAATDGGDAGAGPPSLCACKAMLHALALARVMLLQAPAAAESPSSSAGQA